MKKNLYLLRFASCKKNKNRLSNDFHNEYFHDYEIKSSQSISGNNMKMFGEINSFEIFQ